MSAFAPIRASSMARAQQAAGARFTERAGWRVADVYTSVDDEAERALDGVGLSDVSACGKLRVRGAAIESWAPKLTGRPAPAVNRASRERVDGASVLVCRRAADELLLLTAPDQSSAVAGLVAKSIEGAACAHATDLTSAFAAVDLIGPAVGALLERVVALDLFAVAALDIVQGALARVPALIVRLDHPALPLFRVLVPREHGDFAWTALLDAGQDLGVTPVGATAHARLAGGL